MSNNSSNPTTGFIDLATYDQLEKALYGVENVVTYFVRETVRSTWFTQVPVKLNLDTASPNFGNTFNATVSRAGDYLLNAWLRVTLNAVSGPTLANIDDETVMWTPNFMHNLVQQCKLTFNDMTAAEFYSEHLDFWTAFMVPQSKRAGYNRMIGNFTGPGESGDNGMGGANGSGANYNQVLNQDQTMYLPLPFFFSRDSGVSLPTAALPYNEIKMEFNFRNYSDLVAKINHLGATSAPTLQTTPKLSNVQVWANYALVSNNERKKMGCAPRDIVIEQAQQVGGVNGAKNMATTSTTTTTSVDLRLAHAVKALFFGAKNVSGNATNFRSNYGTGLPVSNASSVAYFNISGVNASQVSQGETKVSNTNIFQVGASIYRSDDESGLIWPRNSYDPISTAKLMYENTTRMELEGDYYNLIQGHNHCEHIPTGAGSRASNNQRDIRDIGGQSSLAQGYHMYSYALDAGNVDPCGSTNYGKLTNISLVFTPSAGAVSYAGKYQLYVTAVNHNVVRISGGALGFPVL